ncbi:tRNA (32-2'-O)-methyltransferase regulator THADA [Haemaphysalis longicornis]
MEPTKSGYSFDFLYKVFTSKAGGDNSLQARIRGVINAMIKQPKQNLSSMPLSSSLVAELLEHLTDQDAKPDTLLLGGTCIVRILCHFLTQEAASDALRGLLRTSPSPLQSPKPRLEASLPSLNPLSATEASSPPTFYHLCLIHGALSAGADTRSLLTSQKDGATPPLIVEVLRPLISLVRDDDISRYHSVSTLLLWFKTVEQLQSTKSDGEAVTAACTSIGNMFVPELDESALVLAAIDANWESSVNGVSDLVKKVYQSLLRVTAKKGDLSAKNGEKEDASNSFGSLPWYHRFLLERTMQLDWKSKPKYLSLACLLPFVPFELCLQMDPQLPRHAIPGLLANHLVSATMDVYRASLASSAGWWFRCHRCPLPQDPRWLNRERPTPIGHAVVSSQESSSEAAMKETWSAHWKGPIVDAIKADVDGTCLQNMSTHLLPWTLRNVPGSLQELEECFDMGRDGDVGLHFLVTLARVGMQAGLTTRAFQEASLVVVTQSTLSLCLVHQSNAIRIEAFSLCCSSYIFRAEKSAVHLDRISGFVKGNLNVDDSWFRARHVLLLESVLVALRDHVVGEFSRVARQKQWSEAQGEGDTTATLSTHYDSAFRFVRDMVATAVENLFPGANYQRATTSLAILESVAGTFRVDPSGKQRTSYKRETLEKFFASETSRFGLESMQKPLRAALQSALFHAVAEVRLCAFRLLTSTGCPLLECGSNLQDALWATADKYLASPRPQDNAVGSLLVRLHLTNLGKEPEQLAAKLQEICFMGERALSAFMEDPVSATGARPLHGVLLTLVSCLSDVRGVLSPLLQWEAADGGSVSGCVSSLLDAALSLAKCSLFHTLFVMVPRGKRDLLGALSASSADRVAPSFEDTNVAFAELVADHEAAIGGVRLTAQEHRQAEERLMSFCWHCIKNSCSLLELVVSTSLKENGVSYPLDVDALREIADALIAVMTGCRHRGAIESCCESLRSLCHVLSSSKDPEIADIPFGLLKSALSSLTSRSKSSSITRRSAGLPLLVRALLEGEARNVKRAMSWAVDFLSRVVEEHPQEEQPPPDDTASATTVDVPQAEALHVLCAIVGSASLVAPVLPHLGRILWLCFQGLASALWLVRNAAHQLYGGTAPRVIGLKKTREEFVGHDAVTALDLFARFPELREMFLAKLSRCLGSERDELYFVLDFLSRLKPPASSREGLESLEPFRQSVRSHLGCRSWRLRLLAAKCVATFSPSAMDEVTSLLASAATLRTDTRSGNNRAQAELHAASLLLRSNPDCVQDVADWLVESGTCEQLCRVLNGAHCSPFVRVEIVNLFDLLSDRITSPKWRRQLSRTITIDIVTKHDCKEPGDVTWRKRQTERLLEDAERQHTTEVITLFPAVRGDLDVMESTLDALVSQAQRNLPSVEGTLWGPFTMAMVPHLRGVNAVRSALELLSALLPQPAVADKCVQPGCLATFQHLAMEASTAGTTIRSLALVVWSHCLRHCLRGGQHTGSPVVAGSVEAWLRTVASSVSEEARQAATADVWRFHAARSLRVAGSAVYVWAGRRTSGPPLLGALQSLFSTLLQLLQDEDPKIRDEAASAVPLECHEQLLHPVQANVAVKILLTEMLASCGAEPSCFEFLWTELCRSCPSALEELQHLLRPLVGSLFEQDESGVFLEPLVVSLVLRDGVQKSLEMAAEKGTAMTGSLVGKATELTKHLGAASEALEEFAAQGGKSSGVSLEVLGRPRLHHAVTMLIARAVVVEGALPKCTDDPGFEDAASVASETPSQLKKTAAELLLAKTRLLDLWTSLTVGD